MKKQQNIECAPSLNSEEQTDTKTGVSRGLSAVYSE